MEDPVLPPESPELLALLGGEPFSLTTIDLCLLDPVAQRLVGDAELVGELADGFLGKGAD